MQKIDSLINRKDCDYSLIKLKKLKKLTIIEVAICKKYVYIINNMYMLCINRHSDILTFGFPRIWTSENRST